MAHCASNDGQGCGGVGENGKSDSKSKSGGRDIKWPSVIAESVKREFSRSYEFAQQFLDVDEEAVGLCFGLRRTKSTAASFIKLFDRNAHPKSLEASLRFRQEGNALFGRRRYKEALKLYSKSVLTAPCDEPDQNCLAMGYANRSATLYHLDRYLVCLEDICRAFDANYPSTLHHKLFLRRSQVHFKLRNMEECTTAAKMCLAVLDDDLSLTDKRKDNLRDEISVLMREACNFSGPAYYEEINNQRLKLRGGSHEAVPSMSALLDVKKSEHKGRYLMARAAKPVKAGDSLFVEKPFASVLLEPFYDTHCHSCHVKVFILIPCRQCSQVGYCSAECRDTSWDTCHRIECGHLDLLHAIGLGHLVFRIIVIAGLEFLLKNKAELNASGKTDGNRRIAAVKKDMKKAPGVLKHVPHEGYFAVHGLVTNSQRTKPEDAFAYCMTACVLCKLLDPEFQRLNMDSKDVTFIGSLMVRHTCQVICNAHAITDMLGTDSLTDRTWIVREESLRRVATAIYPGASLMNHACEPNVTISFSKNVLVIRAAQDIPADTEVLNCYGPHFKRMPTEERKSALLEQYFFDCNCQHCLSTECDSVKSLQPQDDPASLQYEIAVKALEKNDIINALHLAKSCLELRVKIPNDKRSTAETYDLAKTYDLIAHIHAKRGCYNESAENLRKSLPYVASVYGDDSVELGNEILKYAEVAIVVLQNFNIDETSSMEFLQIANSFRLDVQKELHKGIKIFMLNYGRNHALTKNLLNIQEHLKDAGIVVQMFLTMFEEFPV